MVTLDYDLSEMDLKTFDCLAHLLKLLYLIH